MPGNWRTDERLWQANGNATGPLGPHRRGFSQPYPGGELFARRERVDLANTHLAAAL